MRPRILRMSTGSGFRPTGGSQRARHSSANVDVALWGPRTKTVFERGTALKRDLLAFSERPGSRVDAVTAKNRTAGGAYYYVDAFLGKRVASAAYTLNVSVSRR